MPTSSWDQKRKQIAQTMQGTVAPDGLSLGNTGATFRTNPIMGWGGQGAAAGGQQQGLMGSTQQGGDSQMARMAQMPGFNYVAPTVGASVPQQAGMVGAGGVPLSQWNRDDRLALLRGRQTMNNRNAFNSFQGQGAYNKGF